MGGYAKIYIYAKFTFMYTQPNKPRIDISKDTMSMQLQYAKIYNYFIFSEYHRQLQADVATTTWSSCHIFSINS